MASKTAPTRMSREALKLELMHNGFTPDQLESMAREDMIERVKEIRGGRPKDTPEPAATTPPPTEPKSEPEPPPPPTEPPTVTDPAWSPYVMGLFAEDELEGQNPKADGLRRVAELLIGRIIEEGCNLVSPPTMENGHRACVKAWIVFRGQDGQSLRFEGLADVSDDNCEAQYARFATSTAETRAKGRCFRAALKLRKVIAAEEAPTEIPLAGETQNEVAIQNGQISVIMLMADRLGVNVEKLLAHLEIGKQHVNQLTRVEGMIVTKHLNTLQQAGSIPRSLLRGGD